MKAKVYRIISLFPIAVTVGIMTFMTAWICQHMNWTIWLAFLSWALYFMHGATAKQGMAALGSFVFGIILAQGAIFYITGLSGLMSADNMMAR